MNSPYVRRLRLGMELRMLRLERNMNQDRVARMINKSRNEISRLETGQSADPADVLDLLEALGVEGDRWTALVTIARDAAELGWWDSIKHIGERQALYANLEAGAATIRTYEQTALPWILQTPDYVRSQAIGGVAIEPMSGTIEGIIAGRVGRQRNLRRPGGPSIEVVVDEVAVHRPGVPTTAAKPQLRHMAEVMSGPTLPNAVVRILPIQVKIRDYMQPRSAFSIYTYSDPGDPRVVAIDTVTSDLIVTDEAEIAPYERMYERLREAALSPEESAKFLSEAADALPDN